MRCVQCSAIVDSVVYHGITEYKMTEGRARTPGTYGGARHAATLRAGELSALQHNSRVSQLFLVTGAANISEYEFSSSK